VAGCRAVACLCLSAARPVCGGTVGSAGGRGCSIVSAQCEASGVATFRAEQFHVKVSDEVLADLRARIRNTRWPGAAPGAPWEQGTDLDYLRDLLGYWADGFNWRAQERWLRHFDPDEQQYQKCQVQSPGVDGGAQGTLPFAAPLLVPHG
jgi:hypothetical protein